MKKNYVSLSTCTGLCGLCSFILNKICSDIWNKPSIVYKSNKGKSPYLSGSKGNLNLLSLKSLNKSLQELGRSVLKAGEIALYVSGSCCQGMSRLNPRRYAWDPRNLLMLEQLRVCKELRPMVCVFEQVPGFLDPIIKPFRDHFWETVRRELSDLYYFDVQMLNAKHYGANQDRKRLIFMFVRKDLSVLPSYPKPQDVSKSQYLSNLISGCVKYKASKNWQSADRVIGTITRGPVKVAFKDGTIRDMTIKEKQLICGVEHLNLDVPGVTESDKAEMLGNMVAKQFGDALVKHIYSTILKGLI